MADIAARAAEAFVVLEFESSYGVGFIASADGHVVTSLHVVAGEATITANLADGSRAKVKQVAALDARRDLAVLKLDGELGTPLPLAPAKLAEEGSSAYIYSVTSDGARTRWFEATIGSVQVLSDWLTVYRLEGNFPSDVSGSPLVSAQGELLGVVTVADSAQGTLQLGVPFRYVAPLLEKNEALPMSALKVAPAVDRQRAVPEHAIQILDGCSARGLEALAGAIASAINIGAPAYNRGDIDACYRIYAETAKRLVKTRGDCPGPRKALQEGVRRAEALDDPDGQAWVMRDTFDGLLAVIEKYFQARPPRQPPGRKPPLLN